MSSILVGVDGSDDSRNALRWAAGAAEATGSPLRVLQAWQYPRSALLEVGALELPDPDKASDQVTEQVRVFVEEVLGAPSPRVTPEAGRGPAASAILRAATSGTAMIVVGSRGLGGFRGLLLGSVSHQLAEHAPCPVTIVHSSDPTDPFRLQRIVVGIDGSPEAGRALTYAGRLASRVGADLVVVNATGSDQIDDALGPPELYLDLADRRELVETWSLPLRKEGVGYRVEIVEGDARPALLEAVADQQADLLVVGTRGRGPVKRLLLGSVATSVVQHSDVPVTVVPHAR